MPVVTTFVAPDGSVKEVRNHVLTLEDGFHLPLSELVSGWINGPGDYQRTVRLYAWFKKLPDTTRDAIRAKATPTLRNQSYGCNEYTQEELRVKEIVAELVQPQDYDRFVVQPHLERSVLEHGKEIVEFVFNVGQPLQIAIGAEQLLTIGTIATPQL